MNTFKTTILLALLTGLCMAVGFALGGNTGIVIGFAFAAIMNIGTYWFSDSLVLRMYKAELITPSSAPSLYAMVRDLASRAYMPMPKIYKIDIATPNAFATGRNPEHAAVAVSSSLMEMLNEDELRGVLAHEMAHIKNRDILISTVAATIAGALSSIVQMSYYSSMFGGLGDDDNRGNFVSTMLLLLVTPMIATILQLAISRTREFVADETGARMSRDPHALADALLKLESYHIHKTPGTLTQQAMSHMFIINPFSLSGLRSMFSTHPSTTERVAKLKALRIG